MRIWESMLAMLLCVGLIVAFGLTACGDDDDEGEGNGMSCEEALATLTSQNCLDAAEAALPGAQACLAACDPPDDDDCIDDCLNAISLPSSCEEAISVLIDTEEAVCGGCYVSCGEDFVDCVVGQGDPEVCLSELSGCVALCVLP